MQFARDRLFDWIISLAPTAKYNLTSSGLSEPDLRSMGIDTSFEKFASEKDEHAEVFAEEVARLYKVSSANVLLTNGSSEAIFLAYSVLGNGKRALVPLPNYPALSAVPRALGMQLGSRLSSRSVPKGAIVGLTDPNNPTGKTLDESLVEQIITSAGKTGSTVFINETYKEFAFSKSPKTHFGLADNLVTCSTMTKFYGLGRLRVGWILADEKMARKLLYGKWALSGHDSEYSLWLAAQALRARKAFVERAHGIYARNVKLVRTFLSETKGVSSEVGIAPFCLVQYKKKTGSVHLARALLEDHGVLVSPGDFFGAPRAFRLCFTTDTKTLEGGLDALASFFN